MISFIKKPKHKVFDYEPRFYDPLKDPEERRKRKLQFRSSLRLYQSKKKSTPKLILFLLVVIYLILRFSGLV